MPKGRSFIRFRLQPAARTYRLLRHRQGEAMAITISERAAAGTNDWTLRDFTALTARILLVAIYLLSGYDKVTGFADTVSFIEARGLPLPQAAAIIAIVIELVVSSLALLGWKTRWAAMVLAIYTIAAGLLFHTYWTDAPAERMNDFINFWKNISIAGGFLMLAAFGAGRISVDRR
jgi:putative oxidoreductase